MINRGPDARSTHSIQTKSFHIHFSGYVLWQQGFEACEQPIVSEKYVLLFNGDIYSNRGDINQSDTQWLSDRLNDCDTVDKILDFFKDVKGPFSIIFYDKETHSLFFLRDSLGRQTLLLGRRGDGAIIISSVIGMIAIYLVLVFDFCSACF